MTESVALPGPRDVRGALDHGAADTCVVACPPHPQYGGRRTDRRLRAVATALGDRDIACLRFDYGPWDEGYGERADTERALDWAADRYRSVGLFGYSFGGTIALLAAARHRVAYVSALAPAGRLADDLDPVAALEAIHSPVQIVYGERDTTADWGPVVDRARSLGLSIESLAADHHFVGQDDKVAALVVAFSVSHLRPA